MGSVGKVACVAWILLCAPYIFADGPSIPDLETQIKTTVSATAPTAADKTAIHGLNSVKIQLINAINQDLAQLQTDAKSTTLSSATQRGISQLVAADKAEIDALNDSLGSWSTGLPGSSAAPTSSQPGTVAHEVSDQTGNEGKSPPATAVSSNGKAEGGCEKSYYYYSCGFASFIGGVEWSGYSSQAITTNGFLSAYLRSRFVSLRKDPATQLFSGVALWARVRLLSAPQPSSNGIAFASTFADPTGSITTKQLSNVGQAVDYVLGFEVRLHQWDDTSKCWVDPDKRDNADKTDPRKTHPLCKDATSKKEDKGADNDIRTTKSATRISFIFGGGATTPLPSNTVVDTFNAPAVNSPDCQEFATNRYPPSPGVAGVYLNTNPNPTTCLMNPLDKTDSKNPAGRPIHYVAFTNQDRSNFYPKYGAGFRITRVYAASGPNSKPYSGYVDLTVGHDQSMSGGKWGIPVMRAEGVYPIAMGASSLFYVFGSAAMRTSHNTNYPPLILTTPASGSSPTEPGPDVAILALKVPARDFYRIGIGLNILDIFCKLKGNCDSNSGTNSAGTSTDKSGSTDKPTTTPAKTKGENGTSGTGNPPKQSN